MTITLMDGLQANLGYIQVCSILLFIALIFMNASDLFVDLTFFKAVCILLLNISL
jgi:hypothetical protein